MHVVHVVLMVFCICLWIRKLGADFVPTWFPQGPTFNICWAIWIHYYIRHRLADESRVFVRVFVCVCVCGVVVVLSMFVCVCVLLSAFHTLLAGIHFCCTHIVFQSSRRALVGCFRKLKYVRCDLRGKPETISEFRFLFDLELFFAGKPFRGPLIPWVRKHIGK